MMLREMESCGLGKTCEQTNVPVLIFLTERWRKRWWQFHHETTVRALKRSWETSLTDDTSSKTVCVCVYVLATYQVATYSSC